MSTTYKTPPMMACGCRASGTCTSLHGVKYDPPVPVCVVHSCIEVGEEPNLEGRVAKCSSCRRTQPSTEPAAFFTHYPNHDTDSFYCGCRGWD